MDSAHGIAARPRHDFSRFLNPRAVAVVGASNDPNRIGGQPMRLLTEYGYAGKVYPVNPKHTGIQGLSCFPDLAAVPGPCDLALIALSAQLVPEAIARCGEAGIPFAIVLSAGFGEVGEEGRRLQQDMLAASRKHNMRVLGPNCLGMMNLKDHARIGFGGTMQLQTLKAGPIAMVTQSGGFGFGAVAAAAYYGVGFNYVVSTGNEADLTALELIAGFLERDDVQIVAAFLEGVLDGRQLIEIGRRSLELGKPILVWKAGNSAVGRQAATSHTARLTARYELFRAAFRQGGFIEVHDIDDLIDFAQAFLGRKLPQGHRIGIVTLSGGAGVLMADHCAERGLELPQLAEATRNRLREVAVAFASLNNPVDATAQDYNDNFASYNDVIRAVLADPNVDAAIARVPRGKAASAWAQDFVEIWNETDKPIVLNWATAPDDNGEVLTFLQSNRVPCLPAPGRAVAAMAALSEFAAKKRRFDAAPRQPDRRAIAPQRIRWPVSGTLAEHAAKEILKRYGIPTANEVLLTLGAIDALAAPPVPFPVAVKIESGDLPHKTEAGAVRLNVGDLDTLKRTAHELVNAAKRYRPDARIDGVLVQEMAGGLEVIVGAVNDPYFGPVVAFGLGGIFTELMRDVTHRFAPFDVAAAREMIEEIKGAALFRGYRGQPPLDSDALADALTRLSLLIADHRDRIAEIDVNPLFVRPRGLGAVAADALIVLKG